LEGERGHGQGLLARRDRVVLLRKLDGCQAQQVVLKEKEGTRNGKLSGILPRPSLVRKVHTGSGVGNHAIPVANWRPLSILAALEVGRDSRSVPVLLQHRKRDVELEVALAVGVG